MIKHCDRVEGTEISDWILELGGMGSNNKIIYVVLPNGECSVPSE